MCVIIAKPAGKVLAKDTLRRAYRANPDGWGVATIVGSRVVVKRGMTEDGLLRAVARYPKHEQVVHCRIRTSGKTNLENTHPFEVGKHTWLFHNGIFGKMQLSVAGRSDTWHLAQQLRPLFAEEPDLLSEPAFLKDLYGFCTKTSYPNKLVFLSPRGTVIVNEKVGISRNGIWYSNHSALPAVKYVPTRKNVNALPQVGDDAPDFYGCDQPPFAADYEGTPEHRKVVAFRQHARVDNAKWEMRGCQQCLSLTRQCSAVTYCSPAHSQRFGKKEATQ